MQDRFQSIMDLLCRLEMDAWRSKLHSLASTDNPYTLLDHYGRGFTVQVAGSAAYILKCAAKEATRADYPNCTAEFPVFLENKLRFADPFTWICLLYTSPSPRDKRQSRMPSSA